eukprot:7592632-Pyramimonas_sp.AAC.1
MPEEDIPDDSSRRKSTESYNGYEPPAMVGVLRSSSPGERNSPADGCVSPKRARNSPSNTRQYLGTPPRIS